MEIYCIFMLKTFSFYISNVYTSILSRINFDIGAYFHFVVRNCDARILKVMRILDFLCVFYAYTHARKRGLIFICLKKQRLDRAF
jgi:hypothetical protein